ncbi:MAG: tryptophan 7-halogenase [bacterium]
MKPQSIDSVVIVGNNASAWSAALALAKSFSGKDLKITVIEQGEHDYLPHLFTPRSILFHQQMGIDELELFVETDATFNLGSHYIDWSKDQRSHFQPFGSHGSPVNFIEFQHFIFKAKQQGEQFKYHEFSLSAMAALDGKFSHPSSDTRSLLSSLSYSIQVDAEQYKDFIRSKALAVGVNSLEQHIQTINTGINSDSIVSLTLDDGQTIEACLYLDISGQQRILIGNQEDNSYISWEQWLPSAKSIASKQKLKTPALAYSTLQAFQNAYFLKTNSRSSTYQHMFYSEDDFSDRDAQQFFAELVNNDQDLIYKDFNYGQMDKHWSHNCIAFGQAASCYPALCVSDLQTTQESILQFTTLFPADTNYQSFAQEYNRIATRMFNSVRDYAMLHFMANNFVTSKLWGTTSCQVLPDSIKHKLNLYKSSGKVVYEDGELFSNSQWISLLIGLGLWPDRYDSFLDAFDYQAMHSHFMQMRSAITQTVQQLPTMEQYIADGLSQINKRQ